MSYFRRKKKDPDFVKTVSYIRMNINNQNPVKSAEKRRSYRVYIFISL